MLYIIILLYIILYYIITVLLYLLLLYYIITLYYIIYYIITLYYIIIHILYCKCKHLFCIIYRDILTNVSWSIGNGFTKHSSCDILFIEHIPQEMFIDLDEIKSQRLIKVG